MHDPLNSFQKVYNMWCDEDEVGLRTTRTYRRRIFLFSGSYIFLFFLPVLFPLGNRRWWWSCFGAVGGVGGGFSEVVVVLLRDFFFCFA
jgi:hypothetical protein